MMRIPWFDRRPVGSVAAALAVLIASPLPAQVITGRVTSKRGNPLGGASVTVGNTNLSTVTAADGTYRLTIAAGAVRGPQVTLTARYIGHRPAIQPVTLGPGTQTVNFQLPADPLRLDAVAGKGTAGEGRGR